MKRFAIALLAAAAVALAGTAAAQNVPGTWELTPYGGVMFGGQIYQGGATTVDADNAGTFGARLGYNFNRAMAVEFNYGHTTANLTATNFRGVPGGYGKIGNLKTDTFEADGLFYWGSEKASGYVLLGAGLSVMNPQVDGVATSSDSFFTASLGVGGKFAVSPNAAIRVEGRFRGTSLSNQTSAGVWCDYYGFCYAYSSSWYSNGEITGGIVIRFGK